MLTRFPTLTRAVSVLALATLPLAPLQAGGGGDILQESDSAARINLSGKLRMLSQRIPAAACNEAAGIAVDEAAAMLKGAVDEFDRILAGLEHGDPGLEIDGPEQDRKVLLDIQAMHAIWDPLHVDMDAMIDGDLDRAHAVKIVATEPQLLDIAKHLVSMISAEHANPAALMQSEAIVIDIAGRQRMLAQRLSKDACMIAEGLEADRAREDFARTREIYQTSLTALQFGMPAAGITPPPTPEIEAGLADVAAIWAEMQPWLDAVEAGNATPEQRAALMLHANALTGTMNAVVGLYAKSTVNNRS